jgi:orotidine-5'-phosphate decarboxylase
VSAPLYQLVALNVSQKWNKNGNCGLVVGATYPQELAQVRQVVGDMPILIPGIGGQGGDEEATIAAGRDSRASGMIINVGSAILYASSTEDCFQAAAAKAEYYSTRFSRLAIA